MPCSPTTGTKVELPSGLQKILDGEGFKFDSLAEGLQQYLFYSETALRTASNDGEMPVVGKDLQAGADFMGKAREKLDAMLAVADPTTVGGATTMLKAKLRRDGRRRRRLPTASTSTSPAPARLRRRPQRRRRRSSEPRRRPPTRREYVYKVVSIFKDAKMVDARLDPLRPRARSWRSTPRPLSNAKFNRCRVDEGRRRHRLRGAARDEGCRRDRSRPCSRKVGHDRRQRHRDLRGHGRHHRDAATTPPRPRRTAGSPAAPASPTPRCCRSRAWSWSSSSARARSTPRAARTTSTRTAPRASSAGASAASCPSTSASRACR